MMQRPKLSGKGPGWSVSDLQAILDYVDAVKPVSGIGTKVFDVASGRAVNAEIPAGGYGGPQLHNIGGLAGHIPDPIAIAAAVVEEITGGITLPNPATLISNISGALVSVLNGGTPPSQATIQGWVDAYIGTTLSTLIGDIPTAINSILNGLLTGVPGILSAHFAGEGAASPQNGDKIYTSSAGIVYEIWRQSGGIPASNSIFAVPFTVGSGEDAQTWVALTTFPAPDISGLVSAVTDLLMTGLNAVLSMAAGLLVATITALFDFVAAILPLIEELIEAALVAVWAAIAALVAALEEAEARLDAIEALLANITTLTVLDTAGFARPVTVLDAEEGSDFKNTHKFVDPETGGSFELKFPTWESTVPGGDTTFNLMYWIAQDGRHWGMKSLMKTADGYPKIEDAPTGGTAGGAVIGTLFGRVAEEKCGGAIIDVLEAEHEGE